MLNALTIDVEDYWSIFSRDWLGIEAKPCDAVVRNTEWFLQTMAEHKIKGTFFILGEVAEKFPSLVAKIANENHEIAVHGFYHRQIFKLTAEQFRSEVSRAKKLLEDIASLPVIGHRAPAFSLNASTQWAFEVLAQEGFKYDSSVSPMLGRRYGWPGFNRRICRVKLPSGLSIIEAPISTVSILGRSLSVGGGYMRHFPYAFTDRAMRHTAKKMPAIVYLHPYEIDCRPQPFQTSHLTLAQRFRVCKFHLLQLRNRKTVPLKIKKLFNHFNFLPLRDIIGQQFNISLA